MLKHPRVSPLKFLVGLSIVLGCQPGAVMAQPVTVPHAQGEAVLEATPQKVAVFDLGALDILQSLDVEAVAGVPKGANGTGMFPPYLARFNDTGYANIGSLFEPDTAELEALQPDLIIIGGRSSRQHEAMAKIAPTIDISPAGEGLAEAAIANTRKLAKIFNASDRAEKKISEFEGTLSLLRERGAKAGTGLVLFSAGQGVSVHAPGDRFGTAYDFIGIRPAVAPTTPAPRGPRPEAGSPEAKAAAAKRDEALRLALASSPDWLIVLDRSAATSSEPSTIKQRLVANEAISQSSAWQSGRVIYLDPKTWYLVGGGIDGLHQSANAILGALTSDDQSSSGPAE